MNKTLQICLLVVSILVLIFVLRLVKKNKMNIHYAMIWIIWGFLMVIFSALPETIGWFSRLIGIQVVSNAVFLIMIFMLYCMTFYIFLKISKHNEDLINLDYEVAALKKRVEELEKNNEHK